MKFTSINILLCLIYPKYYFKIFQDETYIKNMEIFSFFSHTSPQNLVSISRAQHISMQIHHMWRAQSAHVAGGSHLGHCSLRILDRGYYGVRVTEWNRGRIQKVEPSGAARPPRLTWKPQQLPPVLPASPAPPTCSSSCSCLSSSACPIPT